MEVLGYEKYLKEDYKAVPDEAKRLNRDPLVEQWPVIANKFPMLSVVAPPALSSSLSCGLRTLLFTLGQCCFKDKNIFGC